MSNRVKVGKASSSRKEYNRMVERQGLYNTEDLRENCYVCSSCGHKIKTVDIDYGVTPSGITCPECDGRMISAFYDISRCGDIPVTMEWYRPSYELTMNLDKGNREHIMKGGLLLRPRTS